MARILAVFVAFAAVAAPGVADACDMADQYKLFPLGVAGGDVVALELDQFRDSDAPGAIIWRVDAALVRLDAKGERTRVKAYARLDDLGGADYLKKLSKVLDGALADARELDGFVEARQLRTQDCDYLDKCFEWSVADSKLSRKTKRGRARVATPLPELLGAHANVEAGLPELHLVSVRHYQAGKVRFAVVDLGGGGFLDPCEHAAGPCVDDRKPRARPAKLDAEDTLYLQSPAHHGVNFDTVVRL